MSARRNPGPGSPTGWPAIPAKVPSRATAVRSPRWNAPTDNCSSGACIRSSGNANPNRTVGIRYRAQSSWTTGIVPPARFLPRRGDPHFRVLSDFVVLRAIADWTHFATDGPPVEISINLPTAVLVDPDFVQRMRLQLPSHPAFNRLIVEIDSSELIDEIPVIHGLGTARIGVSIDNVGAEWPSLLELRSFLFAELKVDRQYVSGCADDRLKQTVCRSIVEFARDNGARSVAQGIETRADFLAAHEMGLPSNVCPSTKPGFSSIGPQKVSAIS